jgi:hypothetical protein
MKSITYIGAGFAPLHLDNPIKSMGYLGADTAPLKGGPMVCTSGPLWGARRGWKRSASEVRKTMTPVNLSGGSISRSTGVTGAVKLCPHHMSTGRIT